MNVIFDFVKIRGTGEEKGTELESALGEAAKLMFLCLQLLVMEDRYVGIGYRFIECPEPGTARREAP